MRSEEADSGPFWHADSCRRIVPPLRGLIVGRLVGGFGIGSCAIVVPAYLGEIAPVKHRGAMVQVYEVRKVARLWLETCDREGALGRNVCVEA